LYYCSSCGRELPEGALFCPDCGVRAPGFTIAQSDISPSHFNSAMTSTSPGQMSAPAEDSGPVSSPSPPPFSPSAPPPSLDERPRSSFGGRRGLLLAIIAILAVLLVTTTFETGILGSGGSGAGPTVNSASTPFTGEQLYAAYAANESQADAAYTNKTIYIQDSLDSGVRVDPSSGQHFSSIDSGTVILIWSNQAPLGQLYQGAMVLAKCMVEGIVPTPGAGYLLYLQDCDLVSVQSQTATTSGLSVPVSNL
jgi:hypothetical protein